MSEPTNPVDEREAAVREWERQTHEPLIAVDQGKKAWGVGIAVIAAAALGLVWYVKNGAGAQATPQNGADLTIAERKPVPKLKGEPAPGTRDEAPPPPPGPTPASTTASTDPAPAGQSDQLEAQRKEQERRLLEARLKSAIIPPNLAGQQASGTGQPADFVQQGPNEPRPSAERGAQDPNSRFARAVSGSGVATSQASRIDHLEYKILQGKLIEAVLEPQAVSDLPGTLCATVQRDVYGAQGRKALIPWGSRVCGGYSAELRKGQDRLFAVWNTVRRPDGVQVTLDSIGADQLGTAGMGGSVNRHFAEIFGISTLISIIGAGAANVGVHSSDQYNSASAYRQAVQQAAAQTSEQALQPYLAIPHLRQPGSRLHAGVSGRD
jgi:type IV secretion system protein VirB10